ncbi:MAG: carboxymuconolactone decarboxylase family protein [Pseudomonadota bacterium]
MSLLSTQIPDFGASLRSLDEQLDQARPFEPKIDELFRFALSIKARSAPCVRKHYRGALAAGANEAELAYVFALTMREAAGADDCWTHKVIADLAQPAEALKEPASITERASCCCG